MAIRGCLDGLENGQKSVKSQRILNKNEIEIYWAKVLTIHPKTVIIVLSFNISE